MPSDTLSIAVAITSVTIAAPSSSQAMIFASELVRLYQLSGTTVPHLGCPRSAAFLADVLQLVPRRPNLVDAVVEPVEAKAFGDRRPAARVLDARPAAVLPEDLEGLPAPGAERDHVREVIDLVGPDDPPVAALRDLLEPVGRLGRVQADVITVGPGLVLD